MSSRTTLILAWVVHGAVSFDQVMLRLKRYKFWKIQRMEVYICVKLPVTDFKPFLRAIYNINTFQSAFDSGLVASPMDTAVEYTISSVLICSTASCHWPVMAPGLISA